MVEGMDTILKTEIKPETGELTKMIQTMDESEQSKMLIFVQGIKFAQTLEKTEEKQ